MKKSKQAKQAVAKATAYRNTSKAAAPKSGAGGGRRGDVRSEGNKPIKQETEARKKTVVQAGKEKAKQKNAAKAAAKANEMASRPRPRSGPGPETKPRPRKPMLTSSASQPQTGTKTPMPAPPPAPTPEYDPTR